MELGSWGSGIALLAGSVVSLTAHASLAANWVEVSSDHFVIYSEQEAEKVRQFSERLQPFHAAMMYVIPRQEIKPSAANRMTIFVVSVSTRYASWEDTVQFWDFTVLRTEGP